MSARWLTSPVPSGRGPADAGVRQNARSDRQTPLAVAVGSHRACEANFRIRHVGNGFKRVMQKKQSATWGVVSLIKAGFEVGLFFGRSILARKWLAKMTKTRQNENENFQTMTNRDDS